MFCVAAQKRITRDQLGSGIKENTTDWAKIDVQRTLTNIAISLNSHEHYSLYGKIMKYSNCFLEFL